MVRLVLIGAGGHARVVLAAARSMPGVAIVAATNRVGETAQISLPIRTDGELSQLRAEGATHAIVSVGSVRPGSHRSALFATIDKAGLLPFIVCHTSATVDPEVVIGPGTVILAGAIINTGVTIGQNAIINTGAIVEHDCRIADHVHIAPGAVLGGGVGVDEGAHIGMGATVLPGLHIGLSALIGAGAVVTKDVASGQTVVGVPARVL